MLHEKTLAKNTGGWHLAGALWECFVLCLAATAQPASRATAAFTKLGDCIAKPLRPALVHFVLHSPAVVFVFSGGDDLVGWFGVRASLGNRLCANWFQQWCDVGLHRGSIFGKGLLSNVGDESGWIARYTQRMQRASFLTVFTMRLIYLPYDLVNYLAGFLHIDWRSFLLATALGSIPGTIAFTLFGASIPVTAVFSGQLPRPNPWVLVASLLIFGVSNWIARYFKQRESQNT
jgi:hypothetical protein